MSVARPTCGRRAYTRRRACRHEDAGRAARRRRSSRSTLQQEASRRLGFTAKRTMAVAQQLYEGLELGPEGEVGLITYMRTDSTNIARPRPAEAREYIAQRFGNDFVPESPRESTRRKVKGARKPTRRSAPRPSSATRTRCARYLSHDQLRLYNLIWQRFVASQMADAVFDVTTVEIEATPAAGGEAYLLRATNTPAPLPGLPPGLRGGTRRRRGRGRSARTRCRTSPTSDALRPPRALPRAALHGAAAALHGGDAGEGAGGEGHRPPEHLRADHVDDPGPRLRRDARAALLKPTDLGFVVNDLLVEHFPNFVDVDFTAEMEEELDDVASGERAVAAGRAASSTTRWRRHSTRRPRRRRSRWRRPSEKCRECGKPDGHPLGPPRPLPRLHRLPGVQGHALARRRGAGGAAADGREVPGVRRRRW